MQRTRDGSSHGIHRSGKPYSAAVLVGWIARNWVTFDGWCSARGIDASSLSADRACHAYLFAITEHADEKDRERIMEALKPPASFKVGGTPAWYGSDDDAWAEFVRQA